jgi:hypothetical protein
MIKFFAYLFLVLGALGIPGTLYLLARAIGGNNSLRNISFSWLPFVILALIFYPFIWVGFTLLDMHLEMKRNGQQKIDSHF